MNVKLLLEVADYIEAHPEHYDQGTYGARYEQDDPGKGVYECEIPCCVGGIIAILRERPPHTEEGDIMDLVLGSRVSQDIEEFARVELRMDKYGSETVLLGMQWPTRWLKLVGLVNPYGDAWFDPRPDQAVVILRAMSTCETWWE